ncbi:MAG TPA: aminoacyl-histidine dipeptidase [Desulfobacteraceae bacterium]|nr:beta-Ala-His dipeptidase [Deltaproteobacteria bacterium]HDI59862.1 aminoacyl-histidine dipeptidase [Desulfobacteraceae bacterium]
MRIEELEPRPLWRHFARVCAIPHASGDEAALREMIVALAEQCGLPHHSDEAGNLLVQKPATAGPADRPATLVQAHLDMVCERHAASRHDFAGDPIRPCIRDGWVVAEGTTLGADNGIGVAAMMALMTEKGLCHGPLGLLYTVAEETGMHGARRLPSDWLEGRCLINLDAERDDTLIAGCAGSRCTGLSLPVAVRPVDADREAARVVISGLTGGHSGMDIHRGRANPLKLMVRLLRAVGRGIDVDVVELHGGQSFNALARRSEAVIGFPAGSRHALQEAVRGMEKVFRDELQKADSGLCLEIQALERQPDFKALTPNARDRCLDLLAALPHGVLAMEPGADQLVRTSTNLACVRTQEAVVQIGTKQRSLLDSELAATVETVAAAGRLAGATLSPGDAYPAWRTDPRSRFLNHCVRTYETLFQSIPRVGAMHAGLECGLFAAARPGLEIVAIGPEIRDPHSPRERVAIASVKKFWRFLTTLLSTL